MPRFESPKRRQYLSYPIPDGMDGIISFEIPRMVEYVQEYCSDPEVVDFTRNLVVGCSPKDIVCEVDTIHEFICQHCRFVNDPVGREVISTPIRMLDEIRKNGRTSGDCDELSSLEAAMIASIGIPSRFMFGGGRNGEIYHVWPQAEIYDEWSDLEPSGYLPAGMSFKFHTYKYLDIFD